MDDISVSNIGDNISEKIEKQAQTEQHYEYKVQKVHENDVLFTMDIMALKNIISKQYPIVNDELTTAEIVQGEKKANTKIEHDIYDLFNESSSDSSEYLREEEEKEQENSKNKKLNISERVKERYLVKLPQFKRAQQQAALQTRWKRSGDNINHDVRSAIEKLCKTLVAANLSKTANTLISELDDDPKKERLLALELLQRQKTSEDNMKIESMNQEYLRLRKERDFHRMHHRRVAQEKEILLNDIKRLKKSLDKYQPALDQLKTKCEQAQRQSMLVKLDRDRLKARFDALSSTMTVVQ